MSEVTKLEKCRVCNSSDLERVFDAGKQFLTGRFPRSIEENITSGPLELMVCKTSSGGCGLVQLGHSYDLEEMYGDSYGYRSGLNKSMVLHLQAKVDKIQEEFDLEQDDLIIDIGSNDGTTLNSYPEGKYNLVGVDPSSKKFGRFYRGDIKRIPKFFDKTIIQDHLSHKKAKVITSFSMFYDLESPVKFAEDVKSSLSRDGVWIFEQSYLLTMLRMNSFDTICHEHLEYYTLSSIKYILNQAGLKLMDVEFNDVNGGSFSVVACRGDSENKSKTEKIQALLDKERASGLFDGSLFKLFNRNIEFEKNKLMSFLHEQRELGKTVSILGASTKGNVLLQYYGIDKNLVNSVAEVNPDKFGCLTPGTLIPIVSQKEVLASNPDYLLVLPWHFKEFFLSQEDLKGQTLIFPLPKFELIKL